MTTHTGPVPQKIVLKSTTKMSLNERFSSIQPPKVSPQTIRVTMAAQSQYTAKNKRFAQQMANRPVSAHSFQNKKSLQQRLGSNVKTRLGAVQRGRGRGVYVRGRGRGFSRGRGRVLYTQAVVRGRGGATFRGRGRGTSGGRGGFRGGRGRPMRGRGGMRGGRGRGRGAQRAQASKEDLDSQLDAYMSGAS